MKYRQAIRLPDSPRVNVQLHRDEFLGKRYLVIESETKTALDLFLAELDIAVIEARRANK